MKLIFVSIVFLFALLACNSHPNFSHLRNELSNVTAGDHQSAFNAYYRLMTSGAGGYQALSDSWLNDNIAEDIWLDWNFKFATMKLEAKQYKIASVGYHRFVSQRLESDREFSQKVLEKLTTNDDYKGDYLLTWLRGDLGYRLVALQALQKKFSSLPNFDVTASLDIRSEQINKTKQDTHA